MNELLITGDRGQTYTFEAVIATLLILGSVIFALQATAITPLTASTANQQIEEQIRYISSDILDVGAQTDSVRTQLLYYNTTSDSFVNTGSSLKYYTDTPPSRFGSLLGTVLGSRNVAYNMYVEYENSSGDITERRVVYQGKPSDNAVSDSKIFVIYDSMVITDPNNSQTVKQDSDFYMPDSSTNSEVYNVAEVRLVVWKI